MQMMSPTVRIAVERKAAMQLLLTETARYQIAAWRGEQNGVDHSTVDSGICGEVRSLLGENTAGSGGLRVADVCQALKDVPNLEANVGFDPLLENLLWWCSVGFRDQCMYVVRKHAGDKAIQDCSIAVICASDDGFLTGHTLLEPRKKVVLCVSGRHGHRHELTDCREISRSGEGEWEFQCRNRAIQCQLEKDCPKVPGNGSRAGTYAMQASARGITQSTGSFFANRMNGNGAQDQYIPVHRAAETFNILRYLVKSLGVLVDSFQSDIMRHYSLTFDARSKKSGHIDKALEGEK